MSLPNKRQGALVKVAAAFQSAQGVPYVAWSNNDLLRQDDTPTPDLQQETLAQQGTHGSLFERDEPLTIVQRRPLIEGTIKAQPSMLLLFLESLFGIAPVTEGAGPGGGTIKKIEGANGEIPRYLTWLWDDVFEALRVTDAWINMLNFSSPNRENLMFSYGGLGQFDPNLDFIQPGDLLAGLSPILTESYAHKDSIFYDGIGGTPYGVCVTDFALNISHGTYEESGNSVCPSAFGKDGRITIEAILTVSLYRDTIPFFERFLFANQAANRLDYQQDWISSTGKLFSVILRNCEVQTRLPSVDREGNMASMEIRLIPRQRGSGATVEWPLTFRIEE